ncbi:MAG: SH3 domain-containing protein [Leptospira sp.]|nr:SH3 domain-containing protein [Leptospira sp.]
MTSSVFFGILFSASLLFAQSDSFQAVKVKVTAGTLIVRNIASQGGSEVAKLKRGEVLDAVERSANKSKVDEYEDYWYKVNFPKKKSGWVFGSFITFDVNLESGLRWKSVNPAQGNKFSAIAVATNGEVMAGTEGGVIFLSSDKSKSWRKLVPQVLGVNLASVNKIVVDGKNIWIAGGGDAKGGVWRTTNSGGSWTQFTTSQGLPSNEIYDIAVASNVVYAATSSGISVSKDQGATWALAEGDFKKKTFAVAVSSDGKVFAGTSSGLFVYSESKGVFGGSSKSWNKVGISSPNMGDQVYSVSVSGNGDVYAGSDKGLSKSTVADLEKWSGIGGKTSVNSILADKSGKVIVGTDNGLNISLDQGASWVTYKKENGLAGNKISQIALHPSDSTIWTTSSGDGLSFHE